MQKRKLFSSFPATRCCTLVLLFLLLMGLTGCRAYTLTDELPPLIDTQTQLPYVSSIEVVRLSDAASVVLSEVAELNNMMLQLDGIRGAKTEETLAHFTETYPAQYTITFYHDGDIADLTLYVCGQEEFYLNGYSWLAVRGGMDLFYLDSLFAAQIEP